MTASPTAMRFSSSAPPRREALHPEIAPASSTCRNLVSEDLDGDYDGDGLTCRQERRLATDPDLWDTDFDGYGDGDEAYLGSNPLDATSVPDPDGLAPDERR